MAPDSEKSARVADFQRRHRLALLTLLFTDMVGSTQLKQTLGDRAALALIDHHHELVHEFLAHFPQAEQIERAGDSFFLVFARPSDAVRFALLLQNALRNLDAEGRLPLRDRVGIHVGEVMMDDDATRLLGGLQIDTCARLMALGSGDQILLSRFSFDSARQVLRGQDMAEMERLEWLSHGHYFFKGLDEPLEVCEVGESGRAQLAAPANTDKAYRCATPDGEPVLGWRPAAGQQVPGTSWVLERNLGSGGFGEVWLGQHALLKQRRVFKFCFHADRVRSLKREVTIFRMLRERVGEHPHIVTVHDVYLDEPPFYLVMDYVEGAALPAWAEAQGGPAVVPLAVRLELVAQVADALQAAHDAGVIHRDVKPSNVLVGGTAEAPQAKLADFGIGRVVSAEALGGITQIGFTQTIVSSDSYSGTQLYLSPERLTGQEATARSDIYSLGVVLFQMIAGDLTRPLTTDWADAIDEPLLRDDLRQCFASDPQKRFSGAAQLAKSLRSLPERKAARDAEDARRANAERQAYRRGVLRATAVAFIVVASMAMLALVARNQAGKARANADTAARERGRAEQALTRLEMQRAEELLTAHDTPGGLAYLARVVRRDPQHPVAVPRLLSALVDRSHALPLTDRLMHEKLVVDVAFSPDGARLATVTREATRIWDARSGQLLVGPLPFGGFRALFTPDGARLIVMLFDARIIDATTGKVLAELDVHPNDGGGEARPDALLSGDGETLLTIAARNEALLWNARTGARIGPPLEHSDEVWCARFSPDGRQIVTGTKDGRAHLWAASGGTLLRTWDAGSRVVRVDFHPDGKRIAAGLLDGRVLLWNTATGAELGAGRHDEEVTDAHFSPDGALLFTTSHDGSARLWDAATGEPFPELPRTRYRVLGSSFSPDGMRVLTRTADGAVAIRSTHSREFVTEPIRPDAIPLVAVFSPDGYRVATGCADGSARIWQVEPRAAQALHLWHGATVRDATTDGDRRAVTAGADGKAQVWDLATARRTATLEHNGSLALVRPSSRGEAWLTASDEGTVRVWDAPAWQPRGTPIRTMGRVVSAGFAPDGRSLFTANESRGAQLWDANTLRSLGSEFGAKTRAAALTWDGRALVLAGQDGASVWDARTGQALVQATAHKAQVDCVAVSQNGRHFATGSRDGAARVFDLTTGAQVSAEMRHGNTVATVEFSPDNELLVTTSYDRLARLWDARTGQPRGPALAHPEIALSAKFEGANGQRVVTGGSDGFVRLWDAESGMLLAEPQRIVGPVRKLSADGLQVVAIGEAEHRATIWTPTPLLGAAPPWLADWAEAVGSRRLDDAGVLQPVPFSALDDVRQRIAAVTDRDSFSTSAEWFFAPRLERKVSPNRPLMMRDYVRALGEMGSANSALHSLELAPEDARAWAVAALRIADRETPLADADLTGLDWASRHAIALDQREPQAWLARGLALEARGELKDAAAALDRAMELESAKPSPTLRKARARVLARAGRPAEAAPENLVLRGIPARDGQATDRQIDLSAFYNCRLDEDPIPGDHGNTLEELPRGLQTIADVTWDLRGMVQLGNRDRLRRFPLAVTGIAVGGKCTALHFLHAAEFVQAEPGTEIGRYVIHYESGARTEVPLCNGRELGDWWGEPQAPLEAAWRGANRLTRAKSGRLNLFKTTWTNPRTDAVVTAIDFVSAGTVAAPFVVAISRE